MKEIRITRGMVAIVDDEDYEAINKYHWAAKPSEARRVWYAQRATTRAERAAGFPKAVQMHRQIMGFPQGKHIDHRDGNGLHNWKSNLRICTQQQNNCNHKQPIGASGYVGVTRHGKNRWKAQIMFNNERIYIGTFKTTTDAARARDEVAKQLHGEFAVLNKVA